MSVGSLAVALDPSAPLPYKQGREFVQRVIITITGNYATGGVTLNLGGLSTPGKGAPFASSIKSGAATPLGQTYLYRAGTDRTNGKVLSYAGATEDTDDSSWPDTTLVGEFRYKAPNA